jgi:hypothetical protein
MKGVGITIYKAWQQANIPNFFTNIIYGFQLIIQGFSILPFQ